LNLKCVYCGSPFQAKPSLARKFCSYRCSKLARARSSDSRSGFAWRKTMLRYGSHHKQQLTYLAHKLRMGRTPYWERAVVLDDFLRDVQSSRAEMKARYRKMSKSRKKRMVTVYRESVKTANRMIQRSKSARWT